MDESFGKELKADVYIVKSVFCVQYGLDEAVKMGENLRLGMKLTFFLLLLHVYCRRVTLSHICILLLFAFVVLKRKVALLQCLCLSRLPVHLVCEEKRTQ
jgi:hypothetical protein